MNMTAVDELDFSTSALIELMPHNSSNVVSHVYGGIAQCYSYHC